MAWKEFFRMNRFKAIFVMILLIMAILVYYGTSNFCNTHNATYMECFITGKIMAPIVVILLVIPLFLVSLIQKFINLNEIAIDLLVFTIGITYWYLCACGIQRIIYKSKRKSLSNN
jgi:hypothetical protein